MKILFDSDALFALTIETDIHHQNSVKQLNRSKQQNAQFYISNLIIQECATLISNKKNHQKAIEFVNYIQQLDIHKIIVDQSLEQKTWHIFKQQTKKRTSFIDCSNIAIYKHYKMDAIFGFDQIYKKNKIKTLT